MNRAAVIEQLKQTQETLAKLLALLEAGEGDKFAARLYQSSANTGAPTTGQQAIAQTCPQSPWPHSQALPSERQRVRHELNPARSRQAATHLIRRDQISTAFASSFFSSFASGA